MLSTLSQIKIEPTTEIKPPGLETDSAIPRTHKVLQENGQEVIEILSDLEEEGDLLPDLLSAAASSDQESKPYPHSLPALSDGKGFTSSDMGKSGVNNSDSNVDLETEFDPSIFTLLSDTEWHDTGITSTVIAMQGFKITSSLMVNCIEYLTNVLSLWPILRIPITFLLNLHHEKFKLFDRNGKLFTSNTLIKNKVRIRILGQGALV
ncbi:hypothetical protein H0H92_006448 [Tricholoma furcatifolium]|nr:hypothetical protein H0H92_006448 [Tricholoma furcatifolium]